MLGIVKNLCIWVFEKLELGLRIGAKLLLIVPIILGMVFFNYKVDPSGIFRTYTEPDALEAEALALLDGQALPGYDQLAERTVMSLYVKNLAEQERRVETIALGSSRVLQLREDAVGTNFYNCGMSGGDFYDVFGSYYLFERAGVLPDNVIICLDAWLFNPNEDAYYHESDKELYDEFVALALGVDNGFVLEIEEEPEPDFFTDVQEGKYDALLDPAYYQASVDLYIENIGNEDFFTDPDDFDTEAYNTNVVKGDIYQQKTNIKLSDGSVVYQESFRNQTQDEINKQAVNHAGTFVRMDDYYELDEELVEIFDLAVRHMQSKGVNVIFLMVPYHPTVYNYATENADTYTGFFAAQDWYVEYALENDIPLYGSYNPFIIDCGEEDFYDGLHIREEALARIFPDMPTILQQQANGRAGSDWLYADALVAWETAERMVADRYGIEEPEYILRDDDAEIHGEDCYVLQRWGKDPNVESDDIVLLARYAVTKDEGVIYRFDTEGDVWMVDSRF